MPFLNIMMEPMAGGYGARPHADGMDTGGLFCHPDGPHPRRRDDRVPLPAAHPVAARGARLRRPRPTPRRRERVGRDHAVRHEPADGPGARLGRQVDLAEQRPRRWLPRQHRARRRRAAGPTWQSCSPRGRMPDQLAEIGDDIEIGQLLRRELPRARRRVLHALAGRRRVRRSAAARPGGGRPRSAARARSPGPAPPRSTVSCSTTRPGTTSTGDRAHRAPAAPRRAAASAPRWTTGRRRRRSIWPAGRRLDDNLVEVAATTAAPSWPAGTAGRSLADETADAARLARFDGPPADAGPQIITDPADYVDDEVVFRQFCCPGCWTAVYSAVVPADHPDELRALRTGR